MCANMPSQSHSPTGASLRSAVGVNPDLALVRGAWCPNSLTKSAGSVPACRHLSMSIVQPIIECQSAAGSLFLFDRTQLKSFRRDNHVWKSRAGGKTVQETHEKLKVPSHNCYASFVIAACGLPGTIRAWASCQSHQSATAAHF